ncbi:MAG: element excision factor XisH family protein [Scytonema sp. PMC 1069.18]|nr:element excision factor XisH family protein [Scytonema sp. PMC 1069.18]MEC4886250.1 element excision factor XisH family protein [Scytonema sp. PMC 1070.18]
MPARDIFHESVKVALQKDGWTILREDWYIEVDSMGLAIYIDLAAQKLIEAEKDGRRIAVEIKSFVGDSNMTAFQKALGQFLVYVKAVKKQLLEWTVYLAIPVDIYNGFFLRFDFIREMVEEYDLKLIVFHPGTKEIVLWRN